MNHIIDSRRPRPLPTNFRFYSIIVTTLVLLTSLVHCPRFRGRNPRVLDALDATASTCLCQLKSSLMVRPRYFPLSTASRVWPWSLYTVCLSCRLLVLMWMTWHFSGWNFICHFLSHSSKARRSCWTDSASASQLMSLYSRQSSAKRRGYAGRWDVQVKKSLDHTFVSLH